MFFAYCIFKYVVFIISFYFFSVLSYRVPEGRTGQQTVELLQKRVEELGAVKTGNFSVDCDLYQAAQQGSMYYFTTLFYPVCSVLHDHLLKFLTMSNSTDCIHFTVPQRTLQVLHNSEQPASCFCVLDTAGQRCLVADIHMDLLMTKLKGETLISYNF